jgi:WD repeat-containing protein 40A
MLREQTFDTDGHDKIFACQWLDEEEIAMGTKNNELLVLNTRTNKVAQIAGIPSSTESAQRITNENKGGIHSIALNQNRDLLATGAMNPNHIAVYGTPSFDSVGILEGHTDWVFALQWLDSQTLVSGSRDHTLAVWNLNSDSTYRPHPVHYDLGVYSPTFRVQDYKDKIRDMRVGSNNRLVTLYSGGVVNVWDTNRFQVTSSTHLKYTKETVCMAVKEDDSNFFAVGSTNNITLMDMRSPSQGYAFPSVDEGWGVRSLSFNGNICTIGGGKGRISFFDMRAMKYLTLCQAEDKHDCHDHISNDENVTNATTDNRGVHESVRVSYSDPTRVVTENAFHRRRRVGKKEFKNRGSFVTENMIAGYFEATPGFVAPTAEEVIAPTNAIYTHAYNPSGTRLFAAGGPLQLGVSGSFACIWS